MNIQRTKSADSRTHIALSHAQRAIWLDMRLINDRSAYQVGCIINFDAPVDHTMARQAVRMMMGRHDALKLRVDALEPQQWIDAGGAVPFRVVDVSDTENPDAAAEGHFEQVVCEGFALGDEPLFKVELLRLGAARYKMLFICHHLISDGVSIALAQREWLLAYNSLAGEEADDGESGVVMPPRSSYEVVVEEDEDYAGSDRYDLDMAYWRQRLADPPPLVFSARQRNSGLQQGEEDSPAGLILDQNACMQLDKAASAVGATRHRALVALLGIVLAQRYRRNNLSIGMALHRRDLKTRHVLGALAGVMAVRCRIDGNPTISDALRKVAADLDTDLRHQKMPIDAVGRMLRQSNPGADHLANGLFDVAITIMPAIPFPNAFLGGWPVTSEPLRHRERSPLTIYVNEKADFSGLTIHFRNNPTVITSAEAGRLCALYEEVLNTLVAKPDLRLSQIDGLTIEERRKIDDWSNGEFTNIPDQTLPDLFEAMARRIPDQLAVVSDHASLSYAALDARANRLAERLARKGIKPGTVIGVAIPRSVESVVAILGVLKACAIYLPLDPDYPSDRLAGMIEDAKAEFILTIGECLHALPKAAASLRLDEDWLADGPAVAPPARTDLQPTSPAYIIFTSGSTGRPKGVIVSHLALLNLAYARLAHDPIGENDRVLAAISIGFDVSLGQLLTPLLAGATVVVAGDIRRISAGAFWDFMSRHAVTHVNSVPSFLASVLGDAPSGLSLRQIMLGGEPLSGALAARIRQRLGTPVINMYGPTEACIDTSAYPVPLSGMETCEVLPIGRPIPNYSMHILDQRLRRVGIGDEGELYIGGVSLADGYLNQPDLTAERFIETPAFGRLYRTGDRACWREDGQIAFLGRTDSQIKIRGFRVELGEVEGVLREIEGVEDVAVIARPDARGDNRILAYFTAVSGVQTPDGDELRRILELRLPSHMVPFAIQRLDRFPLSINGKLDERALPDPIDSSNRRSGAVPETDTERTLALLFSQMFPEIEIGVDSHFFELGGHSLLATQIVTKIRETFGVELPLRDLFEAPQLGALAARIDQAVLDGSNGARAGDTPRLPIVRPQLIPLTHAQERLWFLSKLDPQSPAYNIPVFLRLSGALDVEALERAFAMLVARHESLRTRILEKDGRPYQDVLQDRQPRITRVGMTNAGAAAVLARAEAEALSPFDLARDPLIRITLLCIGEKEHVLLLTMHHIVSDGSSLPVLMRELSALYAVAKSDLVDPLPAVALQFPDYAIRQLEPEPIEQKGLAYWTKTLVGAPNALSLPADFPKARRRSGRGASEPVVFGRELSDSISAYARSRQTTPFFVLMVAFAALLARRAGQQDVVLGTPIANRTAAGTADMIGFLVNTLAIRCDFSREPGLDQAVARLRDEAPNIFAYQDVPFEKLVEALLLERQPGCHPIFQAMFVLQPQLPKTFPLDDITAEPLQMLEAVAKFDITLNLGETEKGFSGALTYSVDLFEPGTVRAMIAQLRALLTHAIKDPATPLTNISMLSPQDRAQIIVNAQGASRSVPDRAVPALFVEQARKTPSAQALRHDGRNLTYAEVDARSNALGWAIRSLVGSKAGSVAVALKRSEQLALSALSVMRAGCSYLPLDPLHPADRLSAIIADAAPSAMIVDATTRHLAPAGLQCIDLDGLNLDAVAEAIGKGSALPMPPPESAAYVIYTSGSTGRPKGVAVSHRALINLAFARLDHDPIGPGDRILATMSPGFDVSIGQLITPLLHGATVVVSPDLSRISGEDFWALMAREAVTHINSGPAFFDAVLATQPPSLPLRRVMLGGEPFSTELAHRLEKALPGTEIFNMYGPTETCIDATAHRFTGQEAGTTLPLGRALPNYKILILDEKLDLVPPGLEGELFIGGPSLAQGYLNRPDETALRFIADPFAPPGAKLYRTGDRARQNARGEIEFLGRSDQQVKIRGFRIELNEITTLMRAHPSIRAAATATWQHDGQTVLICYVVPADGAEQLSLAEWREHLQMSLPSYMLPAAVIPVSALPMTVNGKLDLSAMPAPDFSQITRATFAPPRDTLEKALADIWAGLLSRPQLGIDDNFFQIGGHSLLAMRVAALTKDKLGIDLPIAAFYAHQTIRSLAEAIRTGTSRKGYESIIVLGDGPGRPVFAFHPVGGGATGYAGLANALRGRRPVLGVQARGLAEESKPYATFDEMATEYLAAIRAHQPTGPYTLLGHSFGGMVAFEIARLLEADGELVDNLVMIDTSLPETNRVGEDTDEMATTLAKLELEMASISEDAIPGDQFERMKVVIGFNLNFAATYEPQAIHAPITYIRASRAFGADDNRKDFWQSHSGNPVSHPDLACDHYAVLQLENISALSNVFSINTDS
ncbi:enterobactin synthase subunit F [Rhabdaerophilaceae bacterium]